jgi:hypothetical protein
MIPFLKKSSIFNDYGYLHSVYDNLPTQIFIEPEKLSYWTEVMKRYEALSLKPALFCQQAGISLSRFYKWRSRVQANQHKLQPSKPAMSFANVRQKSMVVDKTPSAEPLVIELPNGIKLRLGGNALSTEHLALIRSLMWEI